MDVLMQSIIIEKVFEFLEIPDINRCKHVCRAWWKTASRRLTKCPSIDRCQSIVRIECWAERSEDAWGSHSWEMDEDSKEQKKKLIISNREMNKEESDENEYFYPTDIRYWYLRRGPDLHLLPKFKVDQAMKSFLTSGIRCVSNFSFITYSEQFEYLMKRTPFSHPTVLIRQEPLPYSRERLNHEIGTEAEALSASMQLYPKLYRCLNYSVSHFDGFHVNRYVPGVSVLIVTHLSDSTFIHSRPEMDMSEFPIKSILHLAKYEYIHSSWKSVRNLFKGCEYTFSGGRLYFGDSEPKIFTLNQNEDELRDSQAITIAFTGKSVVSAVYLIEYEPNFREELEKFKLSLNFPTDDNRVIGFLLNRWTDETYLELDWELNFSRDVSATITALFPHISIVKIDVDISFDSSLRIYASHMALHLIRLC